MTGFDLLVLLILAVSAGLGWQRGGIRETVTLLGIGAGFLAVGLFGGPVADMAGGSFARLAALAGLFLVGDLIVTIPGALLVRRWFGPKKQGGDRVAGVIFGGFRGWVLAAAVAFTVEIYHTGTDLPASVDNSLSGDPLLATARTLLRKADLREARLSSPGELRICTALSPSIEARA